MLLLWTNWLWLSPVSQSQKLSSLHLCHRFCSNAILSETICGRKSWPRTLKAFLPFIEAELEIVFPGPYKVPTPISSCIFEGWCHYSTTTPCTIHVLGEACGMVASKMSLAAKGTGETCVPIWDLWSRSQRTRNWPKTMMILNYIQVYSI